MILYSFIFIRAFPTTKQHLDQSLRLNGIEAEPFFGRPFGSLASCKGVEWRLKRYHVPRGLVAAEDNCKTDFGPS